MSQTKPKWLLTALVVVAILGLSVAGYAAPPPDPTIIGPTTAEPVAVKQGNNVYVTFDYISQPTEAGTTRAEIVIRKGATIIGTRQVAFPLLPDTGEKASFTAAVPINTPVAEGTYNIRLQISNHDGLSDNINELDAVLVDNTPPGNVPNFGPIISGAAGPTLTWIEPADAGTPASGIGWYEVSIDDGVNPAVIFSDVSAVDPDPVTPGFQWTVPAEFADGNYTVKVWARDKAYNKSTAEGTGILIVDTTKPVLDQQGPVGYVNNALPTLTARFRDLGLGVSGYRHPFNTTATPPDAFKLDNGDISPDSEPAAGAATGIITKSIAGPLAQGNHTVALTLHDRADNEASLEWEFFVDTVLPSKPATVTAPDPITSDTPAFYWEPGVDNGDPQSGVAGYTVQIWTTGSGAAMVRGPYTVTDDAVPGTADFDWALPDALTLDGDYEIRVWTVDNAGNSSADYASDTFRRDTEKPLLDMEEPADTTWTDFIPPTIKVRFRDQGAGATGFGSVDAFTVDGTPYTATGLATGALGPDFIEADLTGASLGDGAHTVSITVSDVAGNSETKTWVFNIDTTNPEPPTGIEVVGGTLFPTPPPTYWTNDATPQFQWVEGTDSGGSGIANYKVEIYLDDALEHTYNGVVDEVLGGDVQWTIPDSLADGMYEIRVYSVDNCGNESAHAGVTFGVDSSTSTVMLDQESPKPYVNVNTPTLSVRFRDLAVPSSGYHSTLQFTVDTAPVLPVTLQPGAGAQVGYVTKDITAALSEGSHTAYIKVRDYANNTADLTWNFHVDTVKPNAPGVITVASPTTDTRPNFSWAAATDPDVPLGAASGIASYTAEIHNGAGLLLGPYYGIPGLSWDLPDPLSADGEYTIKLWAVDKAGNVSADPASATFRLDTTPPVLDNPSPIGATSATIPNLSVRFSDTGGSGYGSTTAWTIAGGTITLPPSTQPASSAPSGDIKGAPDGPLADGEHSVSITVEDLAGKTATLSWSFTVDTIAPNPPSNVTAPDPTNDTTPTFTWDAATDNVGGSGIASYIVEVWTTGGGAAMIRGPYKGITGTTYTLLPSDALSPDGTYEVRVWSVDNAENVSGVYGHATLEDGYGSDTFVLDTGKPVLSNGTPTGIQPGTGTLTMQFADDRTGLDATFFSITIADGRPIPVPGIVSNHVYPASGTMTGQISADYEVPTDGTWTVTAVIRDLAGNLSDEYKWSFVVDDEPPVVTAVYPGNETTTWDKWTEIHATIVDEAAPDGTPGSGVDESTIYGVLQGPSVMDLPLLLKSFDPLTGLAVLQVPLGLDLADAAYSVAVGAEDMAGNVGGTEWPFLLQQTYAPGMKALPEFTNTDSVTVEWTDVDNEELYELQVSDDPGFGVFESYIIDPDETSYDVTGPLGVPLDEGTYYFRIRAVAYGGRVSLWSNTVSTTVDTTGPLAPAAPRTPSPTTSAAQLWEWDYVEEGCTFEVQTSEDGIAWDDDDIEDVDNALTYVTDFTGDGVTRYLRVRAYDALGNVGYPGNEEGWSEAGSVLVDTVKPAAPTALAVDETPTANKQPTWTWTGSASIDAASYEVSLDGAAAIDIGDVTSYTPAPLADGTHALKVRTIDLRGNASDWTAEVEVEVDTTVATPTAPVATKNPTNEIPVWTWAPVADPHGPVTYNVYFDGAFAENVGEATTWHPAAIPADGSHYLEIEAVDDLDNVSAKSERGYVVIDTTGPLAPAAPRTPSPTTSAAQLWEWDYVEEGCTFEVQTSEDGIAWDDDDIEDVDNALTYVTDFTGDGVTRYLRVRAYDALGNVGYPGNEEGWSEAGSVLVDTVKPAAPTALAVDETPTANKQPTWTWTGSASIDAASYEVSLDGAAAIDIGDVTSYTPAPLADGTHALKVRTIDLRGNASDWTAEVEVEVDTTVATPTAPVATKNPTNEIPVWTWAPVADPHGPVTYNVYFDGAFAENVGEATTWHPAAIPADGSHYLEIEAVDDLDNVSAKSERGYVVIDTTGPLAPAAPRTPSPTTSAAQLWEWDYVEEGCTFEVQTSEDGIAWDDDDIEDVDNALTYVTDFTGDGVTRYLRVRAYDALGNVGYPGNEEGWSEAGSVLVDTVKPAAPTALAVDETPTANKQPTWTWTGSASIDAASYEVSLDGAAAIDIGDVTSYTPAPLADGTHALKVRTIDLRGNASDWTAEVEVEVDTTVATPTAPVATKNPTNEIPVWTWAPVADPHGPVTYNVYFDGAFAENVGEATTWHPAAIPADGSHYLEIEAVDDLDNVSAKSERGYVVIDTTGPLAPAAPRTPSPTTSAAQLWEWDYVEEGCTFEVQTSEDGIAWDDDDIEDVDNALTYVTDFTGDGVTRYLRVRAYDALGNVGYPGNEEGWSEAGSVLVDTVKPAAPTALAVDETPTANKQPTWTWTGSASIDAASYEVSLDGAAAIDIGDVTSYTPAPLADGTHALKVRTIDLRGNASDWTAEVEVEVDTTVATPTAPVATKNPTNEIPVWTWAPVADPHGPVTYNVYFDGAFAENVGEATTWHPAAIPADGSHYLEIEAVDDLDNVSAKSERGYVVIDTTGPLAPAAPRTPSPTTSAAQLWEWDYVEEGCTFEVQTSEDGIAWDDDDIEDVDNALTYVTDFTGDGVTRYLRVRAYDALGNVGYPGNEEGWSEAGSVLVDTDPPAIPENLTLMSDHLVIDETRYTADETPEVAWNVEAPEYSPGEGDQDEITYRVEIDGQAWVLTDNTWYEFTEGLADGLHAVRVQAGDSLGNWSKFSDTLEFVVDTTPPAEPDIPHTDKPLTNEPRPTWTWPAVADAVWYHVFLGKVGTGAIFDEKIDADPESMPSWRPGAEVPGDLPDGIYYLQVTAIDALGNESTRSGAGYVEIDATKPAPPVMKALPLYTGSRSVTFEWWPVPDAVGYDFSYQIDDGVWQEPEDGKGLANPSYTVKNVPDGSTVRGKARAYDAAENVSGWSDPLAYTTVDVSGPDITKITPSEDVTTNATKFTWTWEASDSGCGVIKGYQVSFDGASWRDVTGTSYTPEGKLVAGDYVLEVRGIDGLGNVGASKASGTVTVVKPVMRPVVPIQGTYKINMISTIAFEVACLYDAPVAVFVNGVELKGDQAWRLVTVIEPPDMGKYYVLLDGEIMSPGPMLITIKIGADDSYAFSYTVDSERSGFGFGRLRPW